MPNGFNTGYITSRELSYIDPKVAEPKKGQLLGRSLFQTHQLKDPWTLTHEFRWKERMGQSSDYSDRTTDITTTDVTYHAEIGYIEEQMAGIEYTQKELNLAREVGLDVLGEKTQAATEALNEWEDRLIFNGNGKEDKAIYGLTSDPSKAGFQVADNAPLTIDKVVDPSNANTFEDAYKLVNYFMDCAEKITMLPGYNNVKPILLLPPKEYNLLNRPLINQYTVGQSIMKLLQGGPDGAVFSKIVPVEELKAEYWNTKKGKDGKRNMGMIYLDGPDTADIVVAMEPQRYGQIEYSDRKYKLAYLERMGGLRIKFPSGFVRLDGLNDGSEKWA